MFCNFLILEIILYLQIVGNDYINLYNFIRKIFYGNLSMVMVILFIFFCLLIVINKYNLGLVMYLNIKLNNVMFCFYIMYMQILLFSVKFLLFSL